MPDEPIQQGTGGEGQAPEEYQFSGWELSNKLRPPGEMSPLERKQELASYDRSDHPRFGDDPKIRMEIGNRMMSLRRANQPTEEEKAVADAKRKQEFDREMATTKEKSDEEDARRAEAYCEQRLQAAWGVRGAI